MSDVISKPGAGPRGNQTRDLRGILYVFVPLCSVTAGLPGLLCWWRGARLVSLRVMGGWAAHRGALVAAVGDALQRLPPAKTRIWGGF